MTAEEFMKLALRTEKTPTYINDRTGLPDLFLSRIDHAGKGMQTESGEFTDQMKKHFIYGKPLDIVNLVEECGDQLWYIALALHACGETFEHCFDVIVSKLKIRFPEEFTEDKALNRDLEAERKALEAADVDPTASTVRYVEYKGVNMKVIGHCQMCGGDKIWPDEEEPPICLVCD